jgi:hypothetical protein
MEPDVDTGDFYVTLLSNKDLDCFQNNYSTNFINHFNPPILLKQHCYEIGLAQMDFDLTEVPKSLPPPALEPHAPFFGKSDQDNMMVTWTESRSIVMVENKANSVMELYINFRTQLQRLKFPVELFQFLKDGILKVKLVFTGLDGRVLTFPKKLSTILGFHYEVFDNGEHFAESEMDKTYYSTISKDEKFEVVMSKKTIRRFTVGEPKSRSYPDVLISLRQWLTKNQINVSLIDTEGKLLVHKPDKLLSVRFPSAINEYFGISRNHTFSIPLTELSLPVSIITKKVDDPAAVLLNKRIVHVLCDAVKEQWIGSCKKQVLRTFVNSTNTSCTVDCQPVFYLQPSKHELNFIRISLLDSEFNQYPPTTRPSFVVLHFKRLTL